MQMAQPRNFWTSMIYELDRAYDVFTHLKPKEEDRDYWTDMCEQAETLIADEKNLSFNEYLTKYGYDPWEAGWSVLFELNEYIFNY